MSNIKTLIVDFAPGNLLDKYSNSGEDPPHRPEPIRKVERIITSNGSALPGILIKLSNLSKILITSFPLVREEVRKVEIEVSKKKAATSLSVNDLEERAVQRRKKVSSLLDN